MNNIVEEPVESDGRGCVTKGTGRGGFETRPTKRRDGLSYEFSGRQRDC
jgi:hypothetical protein